MTRSAKTSASTCRYDQGGGAGYDEGEGGALHVMNRRGWAWAGGALGVMRGGEKGAGI